MREMQSNADGRSGVLVQREMERCRSPLRYWQTLGVLLGEAPLPAQTILEKERLAESTPSLIRSGVRPSDRHAPLFVPESSTR